MEILRTLKQKPWGMTGAVILILVLLMGSLASLVSPYGYNEIILSARLQGPSFDHLLGADNLGRDNLTRLLWGAIPYVVSGLVAIGAAIPFSSLFRVVNRVTGRRTEKIMRITLIILAITAVNIFLWTDFVVCSDYFAVYTGLFVSLLFVPILYAVPFRLVKTAPFSLLMRVFVYFLLAIGVSLLIIVPISFFGFGIAPPIPEWGNTLSGTGMQYILECPWMILSPALCIGLTAGGLLLLAIATQKYWLPGFEQRPTD